MQKVDHSRSIKLLIVLILEHKPRHQTQPDKRSSTDFAKRAGAGGAPATCNCIPWYPIQSSHLTGSY